MAWLSVISYSSATAVTNTIIENLGKDIRVWGGNVDAGGFALTNCLAVYGPTGANPLQFFTNTTEKARITSAGLMGIGIAAPLDTLHLYGAGAGLRVEDSGAGNAAIRWKTTTNTVEWINEGSGGFSVYDITNSAYRLRISTTGKVGVGRVAIAPFAVSGLTTYASNAAALTGGLTAGDFYTDGAGAVKVVF